MEEALGDTGRILVRESGTEPLLRVMVEAETEECCRKYVDQVVGVVKPKVMWRKIEHTVLSGTSGRMVSVYA